MLSKSQHLSRPGDVVPMQRIEMPSVLRGHLAKELHVAISRRTKTIQNYVSH